jgi:hypothetical protein
MNLTRALEPSKVFVDDAVAVAHNVVVFVFSLFFVLFLLLFRGGRSSSTRGSHGSRVRRQPDGKHVKEPKEPGKDTHLKHFELVTSTPFSICSTIKKQNDDDEASHTAFATYPLIDTAFQNNVS